MASWRFHVPTADIAMNSKLKDHMLGYRACHCCNASTSSTVSAPSAAIILAACMRSWRSLASAIHPASKANLTTLTLPDRTATISILHPMSLSNSWSTDASSSA